MGKIICLKDKCRKYGVSQSDVRKNVERIVFERARSFVVGVDSDIVDSDILEALKSEGIIVESKNKIPNVQRTADGSIKKGKRKR